MIGFPTLILDCDSHGPALFDLFIFSDPSVCSTVAFSPLENFDHVVVSVFIYFPSNTKRNAPFHCAVYDYFPSDWDSLRDYLRDVPWSCIFNLGASAAAAEFWECVQVGIDV